MSILLPTGRVTEVIVRKAAEKFDADVVVTGELASFLTPGQLKKILIQKKYDCVIISGMCTASFKEVEEETGVPIYLGPRHAADVGMILSQLGTIELSRDVPADEFLSGIRREAAYQSIASREEAAKPAFLLKGVKIGDDSRMKVLAEIMDAHRREKIRDLAIRFFEDGADIVDIGFGFDATPMDVIEVFSQLRDLPGPLAVDTQNPALIEAALPFVDLVLSLHEGNMEQAGPLIAKAGCGAVIVPGEAGLDANIKAAQELGIEKILADPVLHPAGSGLVQSLSWFTKRDVPLFFGAGNVIELIDADSVGMVALLAAMAYETDASVIFCSEHSDKTQGCIREMRHATGMMYLLQDRPYPKDLGIDLFYIKEKRRRREPPLEYTEIIEALPQPKELIYDPCGNFRIGIEGEYLVAVKGGLAIRGKRWQDVLHTILEKGWISRMDHAAYLGAELYKAELAVRYGRSFEQDGPF